MFKKKVLVCLSVLGCLCSLNIPAFGAYYSDSFATRPLKDVNNKEVGKLLTYKEFRSDDSFNSLDSENLRILKGFDGVDKIRLDFLKNGTQDVFLTKVAELNARGDYETSVNKSESPYKNEEDCFKQIQENHKRENREDVEKLKKVANADDHIIIKIYNAETNEFLASTRANVFCEFFDYMMKYLKYGACYTMDGQATEARVQVDSTGLQGQLFPEGPTNRAGVDCSDVIKPSGLRGQECVKLKYYDANSGEFACEKVAELKHIENNDNIQFDMRDEKRQPLVVGGKQYKVIVNDMNDKQLCWFKYVVGSSMINQNW